MAEIGKPLLVRPIDLGTIATGNEVSGHEADYLNRHKAKGLTWKTSGASNVWARGELAASQSIDFCALIAANADSGTQIRLRLGTSQAEVDGTAPYDSGAVDFIATTPAATPADGLYHSHLELPSATDATWWRIDITGHTGDFEASMLVLGEKVQPSRFYNFDHQYGIEDLGDLEITRFGVFDEQPGQVWRTLDFALAWQSEAEFESSFRPMMEAIGQRGVVYCCFDPTDSAYRHARTYMGIVRKPLFARGVRKPRTFLQEYSLLSFI